MVTEVEKFKNDSIYIRNTIFDLIESMSESNEGMSLMAETCLKEIEDLDKFVEINSSTEISEIHLVEFNTKLNCLLNPLINSGTMTGPVFDEYLFKVVSFFEKLNLIHGYYYSGCYDLSVKLNKFILFKSKALPELLKEVVIHSETKFFCYERLIARRPDERFDDKDRDTQNNLDPFLQVRKNLEDVVQALKIEIDFSVKILPIIADYRDAFEVLNLFWDNLNFERVEKRLETYSPSIHYSANWILKDIKAERDFLLTLLNRKFKSGERLSDFALGDFKLVVNDVPSNINKAKYTKELILIQLEGLCLMEFAEEIGRMAYEWIRTKKKLYLEKAIVLCRTHQIMPPDALWEEIYYAAQGEINKNNGPVRTISEDRIRYKINQIIGRLIHDGYSKKEACEKAAVWNKKKYPNGTSHKAASLEKTFISFWKKYEPLNQDELKFVRDYRQVDPPKSYTIGKETRLDFLLCELDERRASNFWNPQNHENVEWNRFLNEKYEIDDDLKGFN